ncbi:hypothetical protein FA95DRAFT_1582709 [Auriscalpium vulgare]|uniref:Uncharacterized protein n=1 Tax=Auriscalpium vulgare TaxID=40419 RepID=A0ACB8RUK8_9AGAM|nr:hypothetical protein FA95DRAFT_1582709 [Auriscalpium vulgare]
MSSPTARHYHSLPQGPETEGPDSSVLNAELDYESTTDYAAEEPALPMPVDSRIRWVHFMLGCAVLLPWNVMITATPFFLSRLEDSSIRDTFGSYLATSFTLSNFFFLAHATATSKKASSAQRIRWSTFGLAFLTFLLFLSTFVRLPSAAFSTFVLFSGIAQAGAGSYLQTSVVAVASLFGPSVMQAVMSGQAAVAIVLATVQLIGATASLRISKPVPSLADGDGVAEEKSARAFFALSTLFLLVCVAANVWLTNLSEYKAVVVPLDQSQPRARRVSVDWSEQAPATSTGHAQHPDAWKKILDIARRNWIYEVAVAYVFVVTLSVFPALTISIQPVNPATHPLFFASLHFLVFSSGDWFGRYLCSIPRLLIWSARRLLSLALARTLFIPIFLACNFHNYSPLINSDWLYMLILFLFGLTNGYLSSMCMMSAPSVEHNPRLKGRKDDVDIAAPLASFFLVGGLVIGSFMSFGVRAAVCGCNPFVQ